MIYILLKILKDNFKLFLALILALLFIGAFYATYKHGVNTERALWEHRVSTLTQELQKQKEEADAQTKLLTEAYTKELAKARLRNGSTRNDLGTVVRVREQTCPREEGPTEQTSGVISAPAQVSGTPEITEDEYERINKARFEENRIQLEALIDWVQLLYREYK